MIWVRELFGISFKVTISVSYIYFQTCECVCRLFSHFNQNASPFLDIKISSSTYYTHTLTHKHPFMHHGIAHTFQFGGKFLCSKSKHYSSITDVKKIYLYGFVESFFFFFWFWLGIALLPLHYFRSPHMHGITAIVYPSCA